MMAKKYYVDVGYERFLGPELFFSPEIFSSDWTEPLPDVVDKCIQACPIDTRRSLYEVRLARCAPAIECALLLLRGGCSVRWALWHCQCDVRVVGVRSGGGVGVLYGGSV